MLGAFTREPVSRVGKFASGSDDPTRGIWSVGVMIGSMIRDVVLEFKSSLQHWVIRRGILIASD